MQVLKLDSPEHVAVAAADILADTAARRPDLTLGLPTGETTIPWYRELARRHREHEIDLSLASSFNLDELLLPEEHAHSFRAFMDRHAWQKIGLAPERCDIPRASADPATECLRYDRALSEAGDLDLVFIGVGADGHVAYNLPGQVAETTHVVDLPSHLADSFGVSKNQRPLKAITVGLEMMRSARHLVLMATSSTKQNAIRALLKGREDTTWPCTLLCSHPRFDVVLTRSAAGQAR